MQPKPPKRDERDLEIEKLKMINAKLRNKIKDLNAKVELAIEKAGKKRVHNSAKEAGANPKNKDPQHILLVRDREIENAKKQIEMNDREIQRLTQKIEELSGVEKIIALEQNLHEAKEIKSTLEKQIKQLEK